MKNILITGGTGFLGAHIAARLLPTAESITIVTSDIKQKTTLKNIEIDYKKINYNIRKAFNEQYTYENLCMHYYNIFKNLNNITQE